MSLSYHDEAAVSEWFDHELAAEDNERMLERISEDAALAELGHVLSTQRTALRELGDAVIGEPVPARLLACVQGAARTSAWRPRHWVMAATVAAMAFALGWWGRGVDDSGRSLAGPWLAGATSVQTPVDRSAVLTHDAVVAHAVYSPEVKHPVEVAGDQQAHLVQWLSKRLDVPLRVPDLQEQGFLLVGGRLLPGEEGARAQLMYQNSQRERITLYVARLKRQQPSAPSFRIEASNGLSAFFWASDEQAFVLSGRLERSALLALSESVYRQSASPH
jgi:anti-sigma factor RsiW